MVTLDPKALADHLLNLVYDKFVQLTDDGPTSIRRVTAAFLMTSEDKDLIGEEKPVTADPDLPVPPEPEPEPEPIKEEYPMAEEENYYSDEVDMANESGRKNSQLRIKKELTAMTEKKTDSTKPIKEN